VLEEQPTGPATPEELGKFCRMTWQTLTISLNRDSAFRFGQSRLDCFFIESQYVSVWALADLSEGEAHFSVGY
jgi:hypothetical protein